MGASMPASEAAPDEPTKVDTHADPTVPHSQADPSTTPIPEEPNLTFLAQQEWYDSQDKIFQGPTPPDTPWQDDDLSAQPSSSASAQPIASQQKTSPQAPDAEAWLLPKPDTCLFNIFGESFQLRDIKEKIAKGQMPHCLYKDPKAAGEQPLNRQEMWAAMQFKPIYRTAGRWTYYDLLPDDIRKPPPQFCDEIEDDIDLDAVRSLDQPGASTRPYIIDISLLDNRAQPLYSHPHFKPIECMIYDKRPWICFYEGSPPMKVAETDSWWYTMYDREGPADDAAQAQPADFLREKMTAYVSCPAATLECSQQFQLASSQPHSWSDVTLIEDITQASDTTLVGQLNEKTQDVLKPAAELTACTPREFPAQNTSASKQGRSDPVQPLGLFTVKAVQSAWIATEKVMFAFLRPEPKYVPPKKLDSIKVSSFGEGVSRFVYSREADMEAPETMERTEDSQGSQDDSQPSCKASQIPEDDAEALMVEKFANEAHSSSDSDEEALEAPKEHLSTFSLFRNGPWGVIHACLQGANRAACGTYKTSAAFAPSCPLPQFYCKRKACYRLLDAMP
ncbi:unnamed protein product [Symbiodinium sp. KB8]|nr:unnamed protein product [Symbiodinium sp. KB8]